MCDVVIITKSGTFKEQYPSLDAATNAAQSHKDLLHYRCFEVYGRKREKKQKTEVREV